MSDATDQPIDPQLPAVTEGVPVSPEPVPIDPAPIDPVAVEHTWTEPVAPVAAAPAQWPAAGYPAAPADGYPPAAYPAYAAPAVPQTQTSSNAIIAIILAVISWAICPIIPAIVALVFASMATKEIEASGGRIQGQGLVTASRIVSWINIGLWAAVVVIGGFVFVLIAIAGGFSANAG